MGQVLGISFALLCLLASTAAFRLHRRTRAFASRVAPEVSAVCGEVVIQRGCSAMGASREGPEPWASSEQLTAALAIAPRRDVEVLLMELGLVTDAAQTNHFFRCRSLCESAVSAIPPMLGAPIPEMNGIVCGAKTCADVSEASLLKETLDVPPPEPDIALVTGKRDAQGSNLSHIDTETSHSSSSELLRVLLIMLFEVIPIQKEASALPDGNQIASSFLDGFAAAPNAEALVTITSDFKKEHKDKLSFFALKGAAWIAAGLRKLGHTGARSHVSTWLRASLRDSNAIEMDRQIAEARTHLMKMLKAITHAYIKMGGIFCNSFEKELPNGKRGRFVTNAFVNTYNDCDILSMDSCEGHSVKGRKVINICPNYWTLKERSQIGTLVHETSHHFGTDDFAYTEKECRVLSRWEARNNADSYMFLVDHLVHDPKTEETSSESFHLEPVLPCNTPCTMTSWPKYDSIMTHYLPPTSCGECKSVLVEGRIGPSRSPFHWGEACGEGFVEVARRQTKTGLKQKLKIQVEKRLCCKPHECIYHEGPKNKTEPTKKS